MDINEDILYQLQLCEFNSIAQSTLSKAQF